MAANKDAAQEVENLCKDENIVVLGSAFNIKTDPL